MRENRFYEVDKAMGYECGTRCRRCHKTKGQLFALNGMFHDWVYCKASDCKEVACDPSVFCCEHQKGEPQNDP